MGSDMGTRRLTKELAGLKKDPLKNPRIVVAPNEANIHELHYVIEGSSDTPFYGGYYHGKLLFPKEYPLKPPSVMMLTPNGRFVPNRRLCLSMSDFHPESWNPMWSVGTILTGLYSFMIEKAPTLGSVETTESQKQRFAKMSLDYNVRDPMFCKLFPEYVQLHKEKLQERKAEDTTAAAPITSSSVAVGARRNEAVELHGVVAAAAGVVAVVSIFFAMRLCFL